MIKKAKPIPLGKYDLDKDIQGLPHVRKVERELLKEKESE